MASPSATEDSVQRTSFTISALCATLSACAATLLILVSWIPTKSSQNLPLQAVFLEGASVFAPFSTLGYLLLATGASLE